MKVMLIDDERLALMQIEMMLNQGFSDLVNDIQCYQLVSDAIDAIDSYRPDVIFMDIHMLEMSGLEAAERIQSINANVNIIFVTAYDQFAIQAFELNALDYLLKPVTQVRLEKTIKRLQETINPTPINKTELNQASPIIYCLNKIRFQLNGEAQLYPKWRTAKAQELFAYLIHHRGEYVSKYKIINMFTPDIDKKRGMTQLYTVVYQIRRCLKELGFEVNIENDSIQESYCLKLEGTRLDFIEWEQKIKSLKSNSVTYYDELEQIVYSYEGHYMGEYDYIWADSERERLLQLWLKHAKLLVDYYDKINEWTKVISLTKKMLNYNPYEYEQILPLLRAYAGLGQIDKVKMYYEKYNKDCMLELELSLPEEVTDWYKSWLTMNIT